MKQTYIVLTLTALALTATPARPQQSGGPVPTLKTNVEEVQLDLIVRDKKGKPITDLKQDELTVTDNGTKETLTSFRLVRGSEAVSQNGATTKLDPLRQLRLVTLAFESLGDAAQRKSAREAALDLIKGDQGTNVFFSVVALNTRLLVLQSFTTDKAALSAAIEKATLGGGAQKLIADSDAIQDQLRRLTNTNGVAGSDQPANVLAAATDLAASSPGRGNVDNNAPILAQVMLDMLRMDAAAASQGTRLSLAALRSLVQGLVRMPGRKSVLYFSSGMVVPNELDVIYNNLISAANRANVTFYSVDTRGVMTTSQNAEAMKELNGAARASATAVTDPSGGGSKNSALALDNAENSGRSNSQLRIRDLAESTGGFLIGESNDLKAPLRKVNEEISSYYEVTYNPGIQNYDGSFRKLAVSSTRKDLVIHARLGYFALPPEAVSSGLQTYEVPLLKAISEGKVSDDIEFNASAVVLQPKEDKTDVSLVIELPLHALQPKTDPGSAKPGVHCSLAVLVKDSRGEVVEKLTRDRSYNVSPEQLKGGNLVEKSTISLAPGQYTLDSAVMDRESGKVAMHHGQLTVPAKTPGVAISTLTGVRSYAPNAKNMDANEPFQFQGGLITPTLNSSVKRMEGAALRVFFTVYPDKSMAMKPTLDIEILQGGKSLTRGALPLPDPDAQGRIPYVFTIPADKIPVGVYEIRATAKQGSSTQQSQTQVKIE
jgi:VWFA-related protein